MSPFRTVFTGCSGEGSALVRVVLSTIALSLLVAMTTLLFGSIDPNVADAASRFLGSAHSDGARARAPEQRDLLPGLHDIRSVRGRLRAVRVLPLGHRHRLQEQPAADEGRKVARDAADDRARTPPESLSIGRSMQASSTELSSSNG